MAIEHHFYMDTPASRHELRDALVRAGIGLGADPDWKNTSGASSAATDVTIVDDLSGRSGRPDNGVLATRSITFRDRKLYLSKPDAEPGFATQTVLGVVALLKAFPEADAYWEGWDARRPMLLRRGGRLMLSQVMTESDHFWDPERRPSRLALVDLPYTVEPLGPWEYVAVEAPATGRWRQPAAR